MRQDRVRWQVEGIAIDYFLFFLQVMLICINIWPDGARSWNSEAFFAKKSMSEFEMRCNWIEPLQAACWAVATRLAIRLHEHLDFCHFAKHGVWMWMNEPAADCWLAAKPFYGWHKWIDELRKHHQAQAPKNMRNILPSNNSESAFSANCRSSALLQDVSIRTKAKNRRLRGEYTC